MAVPADIVAASASWLRLMRVTRRLAVAGDQAVRAIGLSGSEFELLAAVALAEGTSQRELAATLAVTKGSIAQIAGRLEEERLVRREPDGRLNRVYLTPRGRHLLELALPAHAAAIDAPLSALTPSTRAQFDAQLVTLDGAVRVRATDDDVP